jgi:hypothetical protein
VTNPFRAVLFRVDTAGADCVGRLRDALAAITDEDGRSPCVLHRDVAVYSKLYQLSFSDKDFLADFSNAPEWVDVTNPGPVPLAVATRFDEWVTELLSVLADAAAGQPGRWAIGEAPWSSSGVGTKRCTRVACPALHRLHPL